MNETIYLIMDRSGVVGYRKSLVDVKRGQIITKVNVSVDPEAFKPPVLEQSIHITSWNNGIEFDDPELKQGVITQDEAQVIIDRRLEKIRTILESQGYTVQKEENASDEAS